MPHDSACDCNPTSAARTAIRAAAASHAATVKSPSRSVQLCRQRREHVVRSQEKVVLQCAPPRLCAATRPASVACVASGTCRSLQLRRRFCKLAGRLECGQEGLVLQSAWQRLPRPEQRMRNTARDCGPSIRLHCRFRKLDGGLVSFKESMVLPELWQGLPTNSRRLRVRG